MVSGEEYQTEDSCRGSANSLKNFIKTGLTVAPMLLLIGIVLQSLWILVIGASACIIVLTASAVWLSYRGIVVSRGILRR